MINKFIKALCLSIILSVSVFAQTGGGGSGNSGGGDNDDYNKNEFYGGFSHQRVDAGSTRNLNGFEGSYTRNFKRWFGIRATVSGAYENSRVVGTLSTPTNSVNQFQQDYSRSVHNFLGGVQFKNNSRQARLKPFAFALGGVAVNRTKFKNFVCLSGSCPSPLADLTFTDTGIAGAFGGGLDIKISRKIDLRVIQVDYNPIYSNSRVDNNFRIGAGIVFK